MMKHSVLKQMIMNSPLDSQAVVRPKGSPLKKAILATLILTSLVDVFSILVIYLLVNTSSANETLNVTKEMQLPMASESEVLDAGVVIKIEDNHYFIEEQEIATEDLSETLLQLQERLEEEGNDRAGKMIIQADKSTSFAALNPLILTGTQVGFQKIKFAVLPKETM